MLNLVADNYIEFSYIGDKTVEFLGQIEALRASGIEQWGFITGASLF
jgi:hypothetical protein